MAIGSLGSLITFETSDKKILTFTDFKREKTGRWGKHNRIGKKPKQQFLGADLDNITFTIILSAQHGVKPRTTMDNIGKYVENGTPAKLVIGTKQVGSNKFIISKMSEAWEIVWNKGEVVRAKVDITLEEYV